jgi:hypothetical protein
MNAGAKRKSDAGGGDGGPRLCVTVLCKELPGRRFHDVQDRGQPVREPVYLGIQRGKEVVETVPADRRHATFAAEFRLGRNRDGSPNFLGPYAQGTAADRFFYLSWGTMRRSGTFEMFRRLKIRLGHLSWRKIRPAVARQMPIRVELRLTDAKGGPLCATPPATHVKWSVA